MNTFYVLKGGISKSHYSQIVPKCDFENRGTTIQIGILHVLLKILSIALLSKVYDTSGYFEIHKD